MLPQLYKMANYTQCAENPSNYYCSAQARLIIPSTNLNTINLIKNFSLDKTKFDREFIYRTQCIPKEFIQDDSELYYYASNLVNQEMEFFQLSAKVEDVTCNKIGLEINTFDIICLVVVVFYNILLMFATYKEKSYEKEKGLKYAISRLSLFHTWKLRSKPPNTTDFKNLINMNGTRVFGMLIIILLHIGVASNTSFISDPEVYEKCNPVTWHVSADFQLYVINLFLLYIKFKFKFNNIKFLATILTCSIILHGITLRIFDNGPLYLAELRYIEVRSIYQSLPYVVAYMSTYTLWSSSLIGVIFGIIYIKTKNFTIKPNAVLNTIWCSTSFGLIYLAIKMGAIKINGIKASLLGCLIRPIFSLGCALGVYGMSHNLGGPIKNLMESKVFIILSNCVYCVYLIHMPTMLLINRFSMEPINFDYWKVIQDYIVSVILSFLIGIYFTLAIEEPGNMIQKKILPQITKWEKISKTE
ncbi:nose resistant to fluoxetine protein 6-like isoform X2 [Diabrotica virgifera virgifera]|uniref:Acyltransferase 3 domain-containing protein n=1 Tax=Diabrotica virgifera virgifera TaxID=50390 RepID=A0ABM5K6E6_DIAVI|nr:nose resistant to fluoxetine protein 6-like isoform X2 [Diabrotica virgifera virgifera]